MRSAYRILKELRSARDQFFRYFKNCVRSAFSDLTFGLRSHLCNLRPKFTDRIGGSTLFDFLKIDSDEKITLQNWVKYVLNDPFLRSFLKGP